MRIFQFAEQYAERTLAVTEAGERVRYGEISEAAALFQREAGRNLVFLLCRNTPGALLAYLGALNSEAVPLLLDAAAPTELLRGLLERYRPAFCAFPAERREELLPLLPAAKERGRVRDCLLLETGWKGPALSERLKLLLTTSGSTGSPKLVRLSAENLDANAEAIAAYLEIGAGERPITSLPMHYSYGMSVIHSHVLVGAALILTERTVLERAFWALAAREAATSFAGVPYTYELFRRLKLGQFAPESMRTLTQAGGKLPPELHEALARWCRDTGRRFFVMYGQTEAAPRMGYLPPEVSLEKRGSMGVAIPGGRLWLTDDGGAEITVPGETGELIYAGANVCLGYAETREDLLLGDENGGVLRTGDMAYRDAGGYFYITGRKQRFLKPLGRRVSLDDVERRLAGALGLEAACAGTDERLYVYLAGADAAKTEQAAAYLAGVMQLPPAWLRIVPVDTIPRNDTGKILYGKLTPPSAFLS